MTVEDSGDATPLLHNEEQLWFPEPIVVEPWPDQVESLNLQQISSLTHLKKLFADAATVENNEQLEQYFKLHQEDSVLKLTIPILPDDRQTHQLIDLSHDLRQRIMNYWQSSLANREIAENVEYLVGEATSDIGKHSEDNDSLKQIYIFLGKTKTKAYGLFVNPSHWHINSDLIRGVGEYQAHDYSEHLGHGLIGVTINDLYQRDCRSAISSPKEVYNDASQEVVGTARLLAVEMPESA